MAARIGSRWRRWRRPAAPDPLGTGLWRRLHDDCATAARQSDELAALLPTIHALAAAAQQRWPSGSLDVPSEAAARAHYERLSQVRRACRDVAYRTRLLSSGAGGAEQQPLRSRAVDEARRLVALAEADATSGDDEPPQGKP